MLIGDITQNHQLTALELFAGAGGMSLGVHKAGFKHIGLIEWDQFAIETIRLNSHSLEVNPNLILGCDARTVDYRLFIDKVDLMFGGPPCQPFSTGGSNQGPEDERNMFPVFLDAMSVVMPKAVLLENVRGLIRERFRDYYNYILKRLRFPLVKMRLNETWEEHYRRLLLVKETDFPDTEQYVAGYQIVDTADYGIPQRRQRVLITAFRRDLGIDLFKVEPTHSKQVLLSQQWVTGEYWKRVNQKPYNYYLIKSDLRILEQLKKTPAEAVSQKQSWRTVREAISDLPEPVQRGQETKIPNHIQHPGARIYTGHIGSYWDYPAKALKAGTHGTPGGENILRVRSDGSEVRYFTTREAARLHTYPDEWIFHGTWGACIKQLGNAVPVELARIFATEIQKRISKKSQRNKASNDANNHR